MSKLVALLMGLTRRGKSLRAVTECSDRATRLREAGHLEEALAAGREGLSLFGSRDMLREGAAESTLFLGLTVLVEEIGAELGRSGADGSDLLEAVAKLRRWNQAIEQFPDLAIREPESVRATRTKWLAYLSARLAARDLAMA